MLLGKSECKRCVSGLQVEEPLPAAPLHDAARFVAGLRGCWPARCRRCSRAPLGAQRGVFSPRRAMVGRLFSWAAVRPTPLPPLPGFPHCAYCREFVRAVPPLGPLFYRGPVGRWALRPGASPAFPAVLCSAAVSTSWGRSPLVSIQRVVKCWGASSPARERTGGGGEEPGARHAKYARVVPTGVSNLRAKTLARSLHSQ